MIEYGQRLYPKMCPLMFNPNWVFLYIYLHTSIGHEKQNHAFHWTSSNKGSRFLVIWVLPIQKEGYHIQAEAKIDFIIILIISSILGHHSLQTFLKIINRLRFHCFKVDNKFILNWLKIRVLVKDNLW